jgi:peptide/nickel transport system substrate-binding protein
MIAKLKRRMLMTAMVATLLSPVAAAHAGGVLMIAREQDSTTFDPIVTQQNSDCWLLPNIFARLVLSNQEGTKIVPGLAESWTISPDGITYTFTLRPNLKFSDGSPIKPSDIRFSLLRGRDTKESAWNSMFTNIADVVGTDDRTVVITVKKASPVLLPALAMFAAGIVPEAQLTKLGEDAFFANPVVSGAFTLEEWKHGDRVILKKNPYYYDAAHVSLDGVQWILIPNDNARILKLLGKEVDAAIVIPWNRMVDLKKEKGVDVHFDASTKIDHLLINNAHAPLDKVEVRRAINMAIDRQAIVNNVTFGAGSVAHSFLPENSPFYDKDIKDYAYDPAGAKALLEKAGVKNLKLGLLIFAGDSPHEQIATLMKDEFAKLGIELTVTKQEQGQAFDTVTQGNYDLAIQNWTDDIIDPDEKTGFCLYGDDVSHSYYTNYKNPEVVKLIDDSRVETDFTKRKAIYAKIQQQGKDDAFWVDLYYSPYRNISASYVKGFNQTPLGGFPLEDIVLNK